LVTILPFVALPLVEAFGAATRRRWVAIALATLLLSSVAVQILGVAVDFNRYLEEVYAELGLYHPDTLFAPVHSPLLQQWAYVSLENLDLAWAAGGTVDWLALATGAGLVVISVLALRAAWRDRLPVVFRLLLLVLLGLGAGLSLYRYASDSDMSRASVALEAMERPGEVVALTNPLLTEPFQNSYDGHLWVWGVPAKEGVAVARTGTWSLGPRDADPAPARFQWGDISLNYYPSGDPPQSAPFDSARLPVPLSPEPVGQTDSVALVSMRSAGPRVRPGESLPLFLTWQALAPMDASYTVFVQALDASGGKAGQVDRLPCSGGCPTTTWRPTDIVGEEYNLPFSDDAPPGQYQLIAGLYDLETGERLVWQDARGNVVGDHLLLGTITLQP
jgi:hypothetical protein